MPFARRPSRSVAFWTLAAAAFVSQAVVAALVTRLAARTSPRRAMAHPAVAAAVLDMCALALVLAVALVPRPAAHARASAVVYALCLVLFLVAAALSVAFLAWVVQHQAAGPRDAPRLAPAGIAFWIITVGCHAGLYGLLWWPPAAAASPDGPGDNDDATTTPGDEAPAPRRSPPPRPKRSLSVHLVSLATSPPPRSLPAATPPDSPADSGYGASVKSASSPRYSLGHAVRPMTSKTRLIRSSCASAETPSARSIRSVRTWSSGTGTTRHDDGFETWDTSAVDFADGPRLPPPPPQRAPLETIPGSRPVSPAKPLNGPFREDDDDDDDDDEEEGLPPPPEDTPLPDSPTLSPVGSPVQSPGGSRIGSPVLSDAGVMMPPAYALPPLRRPSSSQSRIHPLFRPESPHPPPTPSPGTVIVASPLAGQVVSPDRAFALPSAPSSRRGSVQSNSRPGSAKSWRAARPSPADPPPPLPSPTSPSSPTFPTFTSASSPTPPPREPSLPPQL